MSACRIALMLARLSLVFVAGVFSLWGCGKEPVQVGGELPEKVYTRIVSLSPSTTEILALLNQEPKIIGRTASCDSPETIRDRPIVANPTPNLELIIALQPELVIYDGNLFKEDNPVLVKLREARIEVKPLTINSVEDWKNALIELGNQLMAHMAASKEIDKLNAALSKGRLEPQPRVLIAMGGAQPMAAGVNSFQADVARSAGAIAVGPEASMFVPINLEQVTSWNPDFVFVPDSPEVYLNIAAWAATNAGKRGRILRVNPNMLLRPGARVPDLISSMHDTMRGELARGAN
jgi:iron complex transport system substrate-binding protein